MIEIGKFCLWLTCGFLLLCIVGIANAASPAPSQKTIFMVCAQMSEMTFYVAQEKLYNNGNATKLLAYMRAHMEPRLYELTQRNFNEIGAWVDDRDYPTAKDYAANLMMECVTSAFQDAQIEPDDESTLYMQRYWELLDSVEEQLLPYELDEPSEGIET